MELKGKPLSLGAKILGAVIAIGALALKATVSPHLDIDAAIKTSAFVVVIFAPVDLSMIMGNIFGPLANARARANYAQPPAAPQSYAVMETGGGK
jgi:predicted phage tail protein